jgi:hypothetical protein
LNAFHNKLIEYGVDIDLDELKRILSKEDSYMINKPAKTKFPTRKLIVYYVYEQLQADLVLMDARSGSTRSSQGAPAKDNDGTKYLLTVIDVLSKFAWAAPLKDIRVTPSGTGNNITDKIKQSLKNFSNWLLEMAKKVVDNLPAIIGSIVSFLLKAAVSIVGFLAEHLILFAIALAFALYEALKIGYQDIKRRRRRA